MKRAAENNSDWTEGRELAHRYAETLAAIACARKRRVTLKDDDAR